MPVYHGLYTQDGGFPKAFVCDKCGKPTRTKIGMLRHLWRKHKIKMQLALGLNLEKNVGFEVLDEVE